MVELHVLKQSGKSEKFDEAKLRRSLEFTGATEEQVDKVLKHVKKDLKPGIPTSRIFSLAFSQLRKIAHSLSAYYGTKKALTELGPDGHIFERYVARILTYTGYSTVTNVDIDGRCVSHEIDVIADKNVEGQEFERILIECKFHQTGDRSNDLKTALYIKARSLDIEQGERGQDFTRFLLVSNTSFSGDAIRYASCAGLYIWGANFPPQSTLQDFIREFRLDPVTSLNSLKKAEKRMLLDSEIYLIRDILENPKVLHDIGMEEYRVRRTITEIKKLVNGHKNPSPRSIP